MLKIRLQRVGKKNDPSFRVVAVDSKRGPKSGDNVELLGSYNPHVNKVQIDGDRVKHWISVGAQVSDTVHNLLVSEKIIEGKKINVLPKKSPIVKEPTEAESPTGSGEEKKAEEAVKEEVSAEAPTEEVKAEEPKEEVKPEETKEAEAVAEVPSEGGEPESLKAEEEKEGDKKA